MNAHKKLKHTTQPWSSLHFHLFSTSKLLQCGLSTWSAAACERKQAAV